MAVDVPAAIAAGIILQPVQLAVVAFVGILDAREFRREITPLRSVFNRCQVSVADTVASIVMHRLRDSPTAGPSVLVLALVGVSVALAINYAFVATVIALEFRQTVWQAAKRLKLGTLADSLIAFASCIVLAAMLVTLFDVAGYLALLAFLAPALLIRQVLVRGEMYLSAERAFLQRERVVRHLSDEIQAERSEERKLVAADLHDDVLQPLFKTSLYAEVVRLDAQAGRLAEIPRDIDELASSLETAADTLRDIIGNLRSPTLGAKGIVVALERLVAEHRTDVVVESNIHPVSATPSQQLVLYQVAREALTNAAAHGHPKSIFVSLAPSGDATELLVRDDGIGFDPNRLAPGHFGIAIMRERAAHVGGSLGIDSEPGHGTTVRLLIPPAVVTSSDLALEPSDERR